MIDHVIIWYRNTGKRQFVYRNTFYDQNEKDDPPSQSCARGNNKQLENPKLQNIES